MVITSLDARVDPDKGAALEQAFQEAIVELDRGIVETFLLHSRQDPTLWRIMTVWESWGALEEMRRSGETPRGILIFRAAGAEPTFSVHDVASSARVATA